MNRVTLANKYRVFFLLVLFLIVLVFSDSASAQEIDLSNYMGAKFEPLNGNYLGAYILQDVNINGDKETFNAVTGKDHASFFMYLGYGQPFPKFWVENVKRAGAIPQIAWEPNDGLDVVQDDDYLREFARAAAASDVPIFLRYASEMNGNWSAYHGDPDKFVEKWRLVHRVMQEEAPNVAMVWTVFTFPQANIKDYYPGDEYVDWVGINIYNVVYHNDDINDYAADEDPLELLDYVYRTFSDRKPIQISEWGATHYTVTSGNYYIDWAQEKISRMYGGLMEEYPRVKSIYYFNVNNLANAPIDRRINNYSLTCQEQILETYSKAVKEDYYLSKFLDNTVDVLVEGEKVDLPTYLILDKENIYVPLVPILQSIGIMPTYDMGEIQFRFGDFFYSPLVSLRIGSKEAILGNDIIKLAVTPFLYQGRSFMSLSDLQEILPYRIELSRSAVYQGVDSREFVLTNQRVEEVFYPRYYKCDDDYMLSIRDVAEHFKWNLKWDSASQGLTVFTPIGSKRVFIGENKIKTVYGSRELNSAVVNHNGTIFMGLRDLNEVIKRATRDNLMEIRVE